MRRGAGALKEPIWTAAMSRWLVVGLLAAFAVGLADGMVIRYARDSGDAVVGFMDYVTNIGKSQWYLVPAAVVFLAVALVDWSRGGGRDKLRLSFLFGQAAYVFCAVAVSGILVNVLKVFFGRARPRLIDEMGVYHFDPFTFGYVNASFPSGHAATVGAVVGILMVWFPRWSLLLIELGLFFAATRIAALAHYPSDVATGFLVGLFYAIFLARWLASRGVVFRFVPGKILPVPASISSRKTKK